MRLYIWSRTVSHSLSPSCTTANRIIHGHGTRVRFLKVLKIIHGFHRSLEWPECNSDKATVGSVICTVYTDGKPYKPCVLCETGFSEWIILCTGGQFWYYYFIPPTSV